MRKGFLGALGALVAGATFASAQPMPYGPGYAYPPMNFGYGPPPAVMAAYGQYPQPYAQPRMPMYPAYQMPVQPIVNMAPAALPMMAPGAGVASTVAAAPVATVAAAAPVPVVSTPAGSCTGGSCSSGSCGLGSCGSTGCCPDANCPEPRCPDNGCKKDCKEKCVFIDAEYLYWWIRPAPLAVPVASNLNPTTGTVTNLIGSQSLDFDPFSGVRLSVGGWLDSDRVLGVEVSGFVLEQHLVQRNANLTFTPAAPPNFIFVPITAPPSTVETLFFPPSVSGSVTLTQTARVWGAEANGVLNMYRNGGFEANLLGGFRYLGLEEQLNLFADNSLGGFFTIARHDEFLTRNQFYGGQIGARADYRAGAWTLGISGRVALGDMSQVIDVRGGNIVAGTVGVGGIFAQTAATAAPGQQATIGVHQRDVFGVVPEGRFDVGYDLGRHTTFTVGYTFLYANDVVRPGNQLLAGIVQPIPTPLFKSSDFWAQGVSAGLTFSW